MVIATFVGQQLTTVMPKTIKGDKEFEAIPSIKNKALRINLNENIYGTFAEIGAGQETARNFGRLGRVHRIQEVQVVLSITRD